MSEDAPHTGADAPPAAEHGWQRLSPRKLLVDPVKVLGQAAVPAVVALVGLSQSDPGMSLVILPGIVVVAVLAGTLPWLTTTYRISAGQFQLRHGVLNRTTSTAPLDRVRSVDLEANLLQRLLGLTKVQVGTGVDDERITLDGLARDRAAALRAFLLRRTPAAEAAADAPVAAPGPTAPPEELLARIDWSWLRFAPFSLARLVVLVGAGGVLSQVADDLPVLDADRLEGAWQWVTGFAVWLVVVVALVAALLGWLALSVAGYVVQWWGLRLTRSGGSLHLSSGLFTTRAISVEEARVRGVTMSEPVLLRVVGGAELATLATGVGSGGTTRILPPCPREVARAVGEDVVDAPRTLASPLRPHGAAARRRCHVRAQGTALLVLLAAVGLVVASRLLPGFPHLPWWTAAAAWLVAVLVAVAAGEAAYSHLGHDLAPDHLVVGAAEVARVRTVLETDGIIGWVVRQDLLQRRAGLATLVATTAAGPERVAVRDLPLPRAVALAHAATPGVLDEFLAGPA